MLKFAARKSFCFTLLVFVLKRQETVKNNNTKQHLLFSNSGRFSWYENRQIKTVPNDSYGQNGHKTTYFCVEEIKSKREIRGQLGHVVQIHVCRLAETWILISLLTPNIVRDMIHMFGLATLQTRSKPGPVNFRLGKVATTTATATRTSKKQ